MVQKFRGLYGKEVERITKKGLSRLHALKEAVRKEDRKKDQVRAFELLGRRIDRAKVEEAKLLKALVDRFGEKGRELALQASFAFGQKLGRRLSLRHDFSLEDREEAKGFLRFWFQDVVPCAIRKHPCFEFGKKFMVRHVNCPLQAYCQKAGLVPELMCEIQGHFLKGLLESVSAHVVEVKTRRGLKRKEFWDELYELS